MYLSLVFITVGLALLANALWPLVLLPVVIVIVRWTVIDREERYLTAKFGEEYLQYKARVRRWMSRRRLTRRCTGPASRAGELGCWATPLVMASNSKGGHGYDER